MKEKRPVVGVGIIVIQNNQVLFGKRKNSHGAGLWAPPGGHLEFGETVKECTIRELKEETNLTAEKVVYTEWTNDVMENDKHYVTLFMMVPQFSGELKTLEPHKCEGWKWFDIGNFPSPLFGSIYSLIEKDFFNQFPSNTKNIPI